MTDAASLEDGQPRSDDPINYAIRAMMAQRRLQQVDLGRAIGISQPQVSHRLTGRQDWRLGELRTISELLQVPLPRLIESADALTS